MAKDASFSDPDKVLERELISTTEFDGLKERIFRINYGRGDYPFEVKTSTERHQFSKEDKVLHRYWIYLYERGDDEAYLVAFRVGHYSCKSAVLSSMSSFLGDANIVAKIEVIPIPESLLSFGEVKDIYAIEYGYVEKSENDDLSSDDSKEKKVKKVFSRVKVDIIDEDRREKLFGTNIISSVMDFFSRNKRERICETFDVIMKSDELEADPDSMKIGVSIGGKKHMIDLSDLESLLFYYDITDRVETDDQGYAKQESVTAATREYIKEVIKVC